MKTEEKTALIVGIKFQPVGKIYHFDAADLTDIKMGDYVIVSTSRGRELGEVVQLLAADHTNAKGSHKPVERRATPRDLVMRRMWQRRELEAMIDCRAKAAELGLTALKIVRAEYSYDGSRLTFLYNSEVEEDADPQELYQEMRKTYSNARIDFKQVGPRDVAKILTGMGACGLAERCCSKFLTEFSPISIRMAKAQGISLNPSEITGMCGRLRCCLMYEYEQYVEARKQLPKIKKRVVTPRGEGKVIDLLPLKDAVVVQLEEGQRVEFHRDEIQPYEEWKALQEKARAPCDKHENGGCDCGKGEGK
ncbi:MAG: regulatory iron-sulfur-containing complex subunit RicT [Anaerolineales bacterium]|nr:regulatory iron-sulfur-containing complex subunit RicT [Anaerolineales bacterium]